MSREQQVAQVITDLRDYVPTSMDDAALDFAARQIVATFLPQVTTVAELEALPYYTWLIGQGGYGGFATYQKVDGAHLDTAGTLRTFEVALEHDVLTVVWQPEVTS